MNDPEPDRAPRTTGHRRWHSLLVRLLPLLVLAAGAGLTALAITSSSDSLAAERDRIAATDAATTIQSRVDSYGEVLLSLRGFYEGSTSVDREEFSRFMTTGQFFERYPGIFVVEWAPRVPSAEVAAFEARVRQAARQAGDDTLAAFAVHPKVAGPVHFPLEYIHPPDDPEVFGLDLAFERSRRETIATARDTGRIHATAPVELVEGGTGLLMIAAIYDKRTASAGCETDSSARCTRMRRNGFVGVIAAVFRTSELFAAIPHPEGLRLSAFDRGTAGEETADPVALSRDPVGGPIEREATVAAYGREWGIEFHALGSVRGPLTSVWLVGFAGALMTVALAGFAHVAGGARRRAEARARVLTRDLARANEDLVRSNRDLEQFAYIASHDLQTPFRNMRQLAAVIREDIEYGDAESVQESLELLEASGVRAEDLIRGLLAYSRIGGVVEDDEDVDLGEVATRVAFRLSGPLQEVEGQVTVGEMAWVHASELQVEQALENLVANAIKYRHPDRPPRITISASRAGDEVTIRVADNGRGIDPRFAEQVFRMFERLVGDDDTPGSGIGLALVRRIAQRHGGRVWVEGSPQGGSTFALVLPAAHGAPAAASA